MLLHKTVRVQKDSGNTSVGRCSFIFNSDSSAYSELEANYVAPPCLSLLILWWGTGYAFDNVEMKLFYHNKCYISYLPGRNLKPVYRRISVTCFIHRNVSWQRWGWGVVRRESEVFWGPEYWTFFLKILWHKCTKDNNSEKDVLCKKKKKKRLF